MLYKRRKRLSEVAEREAAGESFWTQEFDQTVRTKLIHLISDLVEPAPTMAAARRMILRDEGVATLGTDGGPVFDFEYYVMNGSTEDVATAAEAVRRRYKQEVETADPIVSDPQKLAQFTVSVRLFDEAWNTILREHRVEYEMVEGLMVDVESQELHTEVVAPALRLFSGREGWNAVEDAYQAALGEIHGGTPSDAITDAGTALQEALQALGCDGNSLGPLLDDAKAKGLLAAHDSPLIDAFKKIGDWVSADRSVKGDTHNARAASKEDAWLAVHVVGALLLRLATGGPRDD